jgi:hypothetical protein
MVVIPFTRKRILSRLREETLSNKMIQLTSEVKYLGLKSDKGLIWKKRLDNVINKAYGAFWTCRRKFGKTWGLKPRVAYWIYTAAVGPIVTYVATVWWPRVKLKACRAETEQTAKNGLLGTHRSDENDSYSGNQSPPGTLSTLFAARSRGQIGLQTINGNLSQGVLDMHMTRNM